MIKKWTEIDRATGEVLRVHQTPNPERAFHKKYVLLELERLDKPVFDETTEKIQRVITQPDLSDLSVDVDPTAKRVEGWEIVPLDQSELEQQKYVNIDRTNRYAFRMVEDLLTLIATGSTLDRNAFPSEVWERINARRTLRGEESI